MAHMTMLSVQLSSNIKSLVGIQSFQIQNSRSKVQVSKSKVHIFKGQILGLPKSNSQRPMTKVQVDVFQLAGILIICKFLPEYWPYVSLYRSTPFWISGRRREVPFSCTESHQGTTGNDFYNTIMTCNAWDCADMLLGQFWVRRIPERRHSISHIAFLLFPYRSLCWPQGIERV